MPGHLSDEVLSALLHALQTVGMFLWERELMIGVVGLVSKKFDGTHKFLVGWAGGQSAVN